MFLRAFVYVVVAVVLMPAPARALAAPNSAPPSPQVAEPKSGDAQATDPATPDTTAGQPPSSAPAPAPAATAPAQVPPPAVATPEKQGKKHKKKHETSEAPLGYRKRTDDPAATAESSDSVPGQVSYRPGKGVYLGGDDFQMRLRTIVQPMARFIHNSNVPDSQINAELRRVRIGIDTRVPHDLRVKVEVQVKNMHWGLSNIYGAWEPSDRLELQVGYMKPPGGLERDTFSFDEPFIERSVVAFLTYDKEIGMKLAGHTWTHQWHWAVAVARPAAPGTDGGDPEDLPMAPPGVDLDDMLNGAANWDINARGVWTPNKHFELGLTGVVRFRPDGALGDRLAEPYDTSIFGPRPWSGTAVHAGADAAASLPHVRIMAEGGVRQDGRATDVGAAGRLRAGVGYLVLGWTPNGHYGHALDGAPLRDGWEIIARVEAAHLVPAAGDGHSTNWVSGTVGVHWELSEQLRVQADFAYEVFDAHAEPMATQANARRIFGQLWAVFRL
jgi:hypothetical protein